MFSNDNSNGFGNGQAMALGGAQTYGSGGQTGDGTRPASSAWMFAGDPVWRI